MTTFGEELTPAERELVALAKRHQIVSCGLRDFMEIVFLTLPPTLQADVENLRVQIAKDLNNCGAWLTSDANSLD